MKIQTCLHSYRKNINQISTLGFCIASRSDNKSSSISKMTAPKSQPLWVNTIQHRGFVQWKHLGNYRKVHPWINMELNNYGCFLASLPCFSMWCFFHFISMSFESLIMCYFSRCGVFHVFFQVFPPTETSSGSHVTFNGFLPFFFPVVSCTRAFTSPSKFSQFGTGSDASFFGAISTKVRMDIWMVAMDSYLKIASKKLQVVTPIASMGTGISTYMKPIKINLKYK